MQPGMRGLATGAAFALAVVAACGDSPPSPEPVEQPLRIATTADLTGPWSPTPFLLDASDRLKIEASCRRDIELPPDSSALVVDVRGAGVATVRMAGATSGNCNALELLPSGEVTGAGGGWSGPEQLSPAEPGRMDHLDVQAVSGGELAVAGWSVHGRTGLGVAAVTVEVEGLPMILTTLENGWFSAWWPVEFGAAPRLNVQGNPRRSPPFVIRARDAFGNVIDEVFRSGVP